MVIFNLQKMHKFIMIAGNFEYSEIEVTPGLVTYGIIHIFYTEQVSGRHSGQTAKLEKNAG